MNHTEEIAMESSLFKIKSAVKFIVFFSLLLLSLLFFSPANAASSTREVNASVHGSNAAPVQLAYYRGHYHRHWRGYHYHRGPYWHRGYHHRGYHRGHYHRHW